MRLDNRGQILGYAVISLLLILGMAGLALDGGFYWEGRRRAQNAADAAALAGAWELTRNPTPNYSAAALAGATQNGFTNDSSTTVTPYRCSDAGSSCGAYAGNSKFVEAVVSRNESTMLLGALGITSMSPAARAVAGPETTPICVQALDGSDAQSILAGTSTLNMPGCAMLVNSSAGNALQLSNTTVTAQTIQVVGSDSITGGSVSPTPQTGTIPVTDPFATLAAPPPSPPYVCTSTNKICSGLSCTGANALSPGVYCQGITVASATVTFNAGAYILLGGGMSVIGSTSVLQTAAGAGVTFYNTTDASHATNKAISISGGSSVTLHACDGSSYSCGPSSNAAIPGILFFQASSNTVAATIAGPTTMNLTGVMYFPAAKVTYSGGSGTLPTPGPNSCTEIVANQVSFSGNAALASNCSSFPNGATISTVALAE